MAIFFAISLWLPAAVAPDGPPGPRNLDFESGAAGESPPGWFVPTRGFTAELTTEGARQGTLCVRLSGVASAGVPFGNLMQSFDAGSLRGKRVRFRAAVRTDGKTRAQLWLRVDRAGGGRGFFDNMGDRPIRGATWDSYTIEGNVHDAAARINVGLMIVPGGTAWVDDVSIEVVGEVAKARVDPPRALSGRGLENLVALTKLLGYVRHFHPSDEAARADWDGLAIDAVRAVEPAVGPAELERALEEVFRPVAPAVRVFPSGKRPERPGASRPPAGATGLEVVFWEHHGWGQQAAGESIYRSGRVRRPLEGGAVPGGAPDPAKPFEADLGGGVACLVPLALFADGGGTLPRAESAEAAEADSALVERSGDDRATRLAAVALAWNVFQHFYPYFDVVGADWDGALRRTLAAAAEDPDAAAFADTLRRLTAELDDGHVHVVSPEASVPARLPLSWDWIEERLVITAVSGDAPSGLRRGDVVLAIDGTPAAEAIADAEALVSAATATHRKLRALERLLRAPRAVTLEVASSAGERRTVVVQTASPGDGVSESRPDVVAEVRPGIVYVDIDRLADDAIDDTVGRLEKARGIVFDLRGYPRAAGVWRVLGHLTGERMESQRWLVPRVMRPDHEAIEYELSGWPVLPQRPRLEAPAVFLTDARAISAAETFLGFVEHYRLAEIAGAATAGTNGNVNTIELPGGFRVSWTGMRVLKQDGAVLHGVGIRPTFPVERTIQGVVEGCDEVLERAVELLELDMEIARLGAAIEASPDEVALHSRRGDAHLFRRRFPESIADFERMIAIDPEVAVSHWRLGIAYYFAGRYSEGARQFELYHRHDTVDRENGIWRFLCQARVEGEEVARRELLRYGRGDREPFVDLYGLYAGRKTAVEVLDRIAGATEVAESERERRLFYAHYYVGLHEEVEGREESAREHLRKAVANRWGRTAQSGGPTYMWRVARVHHEILETGRAAPRLRSR